MSRWCPSCGREWPADRETCPRCLASLVDDLGATIVCAHCGTPSPPKRQTCPNCLAELRPDPLRAGEAVAAVLATGRRLPRPGTPPFAQGPDCSLLRVQARSSLILCGPDQLVVATVEGRDHRAVPPLACKDLDGTVLFRLERYEAAPDALVATAPDGSALGTYLRWRDGLTTGLHVRDATSAPAAVLRPVHAPEVGYELVETGGGVVAICNTAEADLDGWIDDHWTLRVVIPVADLPVRPLAAVAMLLAAKVLLGRAVPETDKRPTVAIAEEEVPWRS